MVRTRRECKCHICALFCNKLDAFLNISDGQVCRNAQSMVPTDLPLESEGCESGRSSMEMQGFAFSVRAASLLSSQAAANKCRQEGQKIVESG